MGSTIPLRDLLASEFPLMNDRSIIDPIPYLVKRFLKIPTDQKIAGIFFADILELFPLFGWGWWFQSP